MPRLLHRDRSRTTSARRPIVPLRNAPSHARVRRNPVTTSEGRRPSRRNLLRVVQVADLRGIGKAINAPARAGCPAGWDFPPDRRGPLGNLPKARHGPGLRVARSRKPRYRRDCRVVRSAAENKRAASVHRRRSRAGRREHRDTQRRPARIPRCRCRYPARRPPRQHAWAGALYVLRSRADDSTIPACTGFLRERRGGRAVAEPLEDSRVDPGDSGGKSQPAAALRAGALWPFRYREGLRPGRPGAIALLGLRPRMW